MLEHLDVSNLALSSASHIDFYKGMACITGETGAGKSLIVDALSLVLGARADSLVIRDGMDKCQVSAIFSIKDNAALKARLTELELVNEDNEDELVLRRVIQRDGKSRAFVNSQSSTISVLKELAAYLVSIHGQHASIKLIDEKNQLKVLDSYAGLEKESADLQAAFNAYNVKRRELTALATLQKDEAALYKSLRHELEELNRLELDKGDYEELEKTFDSLVHREHLNSAVTLALGALDNDESNIIDILNARLSDLVRVENYAKGTIAPVIENLNNALSYLADAREMLSDIAGSSIAQSSIEIEQKMSKCHELSRRFGVAPSQLYLQREQLQQRIDDFLLLKDKINAKTAEVKALRDIYEKKSQELSDKRHEAAERMSLEVTDKIHTLAMPDGIFKVSIEVDNECKPRAEGRDNVSFIFCANRGQELRAIGDVASGGELSRLALAIEVLSLKQESCQTLIFDEVDTGISGRTASSVGDLLKTLGHKVQVITITHLPQVAAKATSHYLVSKFNSSDGVQSTIDLLDVDGRVDELARMMGGNVVTEDTLKSARSLLES